MGLLDLGLLDRARALMDSMRSKFQLSLNRQGSELKRARHDLLQSEKRAEEAESRLKAMQDENAHLKERVAEIKKSWDTFQAVASDANKIQQLITAFKRIKRELLDIRRELDLSVNASEALRKENARFRLLRDESSAECKLDVSGLLELNASLKKENSQLKTRCDQQERLVKSLKDKEEKLVASLRRNNM